VSAPGAPDTRRSRLPLAVAGVLLILLASAAGGFLLHRLVRPPVSTLRPIAISAAPAAPAPATPGEPPVEPEVPAHRIPDRVPDIALPGLDGRTVHLHDFHGHLLVVNFWAPWCEPCRREIPLLQALARERARNGLEVVGIALDHPADVDQYVKEHGIRYPVVVAEKGALEAAGAFGMDTVLPFSVFADRQGNIVTVKVGELRAGEAAVILDRLQDLDRGRIDLKSAREAISAGVAQVNATRSPAPGT